MKKIRYFDERQIRIRGQIYEHFYFATVAALLLNCLLNLWGIVWADVGFQYAVLLILLMTGHEVECLLRGVDSDLHRIGPAQFPIVYVVLGVSTAHMGRDRRKTIRRWCTVRC